MYFNYVEALEDGRFHADDNDADEDENVVPRARRRYDEEETELATDEQRRAFDAVYCIPVGRGALWLLVITLWAPLLWAFGGGAPCPQRQIAALSAAFVAFVAPPLIALVPVFGSVDHPRARPGIVPLSFLSAMPVAFALGFWRLLDAWLQHHDHVTPQSMMSSSSSSFEPCTSDRILVGLLPLYVCACAGSLLWSAVAWIGLVLRRCSAGSGYNGRDERDAAPRNAGPTNEDGAV
ncbi:Hypothetical protein UVM_LOCUS45 [uncultured virus]|nr:Hypothetical protein UVM_LOCUS45 [uncultured virus]